MEPFGLPDLSMFAPDTPSDGGFSLPDLSQFAPDDYSPGGNLVSNSGRWLIEDGDTIIDQQTGEVFRLNGMDTPETVHAEKGWNRAELGSAEAAQRTRQFVDALEQQHGSLPIQSSGQKDVYGRTLATLPGHGAEMVRGGFARPEFQGSNPEMEQARVERMLATMNGATTPGFEGVDSAQQEAAREAVNRAAIAGITSRSPVHNTGGTFARSVQRGIDQSAMLGGSALEALGQLTGIDAVENAGSEIAKRNEGRAMRNPAEVPSWDDVHDAGDFGTFALEKVGEQVANLALMAAGGGIGGAVGKRALGSVLAGRMAGTTSATYPLAVGEVQSELREGGIESPGTAFLAGIPIAGLDAFGFEMLLGRFFGGREIVAKNLLEALAKEVPKAMGFGAMTEMPTEMAQELMVITARAMHDPTYEIFSDANIKRLRDAGLAGGIVGGVFGGAGGAVRGMGYEQPGAGPRDTSTVDAMRKLAERPADQLNVPPPGPPPGGLDLSQYQVGSTEPGGTTGGAMPGNVNVPFRFMDSQGGPVDPTETRQGQQSAQPWYAALPDDLEVEMDVTAADTGEVHRAKLPAKQTAMELEQSRDAYLRLRACLAR